MQIRIRADLDPKYCFLLSLWMTRTGESHAMIFRSWFSWWTRCPWPGPTVRTRRASSSPFWWELQRCGALLCSLELGKKPFLKKNYETGDRWYGTVRYGTGTVPVRYRYGTGTVRYRYVATVAGSGTIVTSDSVNVQIVYTHFLKL